MSNQEKSPWDTALNERLRQWQAGGLSRSLRTVHARGVDIMVEMPPTLLSFASNDYLGLAQHPRLIEAAKKALDKSGTGSRASPLIVGHRLEHGLLEFKLAALKFAHSALVFPSGFQASLATLGALATEEDTILLDRLAHACLLDGAKLSGARIRVFKHNDVTDLKKLLRAEAPRRCIVAVESVYSMDGDIAPLEEIADLTEDHGALLLVDEAHATGVMGKNGLGLVETLGVPLPEHVIALGTFSKALGSQGGYICATELVTKTVVHAGRAYLFSTALAPASAAAANAALELLQTEPERRTKVLQLAKDLRGELEKTGLSMTPTALVTPIIPVLLGSETRATAWSEELLKRGLFVPAIRYPTVKKGQARLRVSLSAEHSRGDIQRLAVELKLLKESGFAADA